MGQVEIRFAAGVEAFKNGVPRDGCPFTDSTFDWTCGWDSALARKQIIFQDYIKFRVLLEEEFIPAGRRIHREAIQDARQRRIVRLEEEYPDFRAAFTEYQATRRKR